MHGAHRIDAAGGTLLPGFADTHSHPFEYGWLKRNVDLRGTGNMTGVRLRLFARVQRARPGEWITGMGWDQEALSERRMPDRADIDDVTPKNPAVLTRVCGHTALLNTRALELLGLQEKADSQIERDASGRLTGIVKERALEEVYSRLPRAAEAYVEYILTADREAARCGLTTIHAILSTAGYREELRALSELASASSLSLRYRAFVPFEALPYLKESGVASKLGPSVWVAGVKIYADGSLGARTAALHEPYSDDAANVGILRHSDEELAEMVARADGDGYQIAIHAIGDRAVDQAVDALARVAGARNPRRHRVEHASILTRQTMAKMAKHGIRAAVQPLFIASDSWAVQRLGDERARSLYPFKSMLGAGIVASGSSDSPIEQMSPVLGVWAAMARPGYPPGEELNQEDGLALYTTNAASNGFDEEGWGVSEGSDANLTLLDSDIRGMHPALFRKVGVAATLVCGRVVHSATGVDW